MRLAAALIVLCAGCGQAIEPVIDAGVADLPERDLSVADLTEPPFCTDNDVGDAGLPATMTNVQGVFERACVGCHCCGDAVDLTAGNAHDSVVGRALSPENLVDETCGGKMVTPFDVAHSYLYQKLTQPTPCAGDPMPPPDKSAGPVPACQIDLVRRWIEAGAPP